METAFVGEAYETGMAVYIIYRGGGNFIDQAPA